MPARERWGTVLMACGLTIVAGCGTGEAESATRSTAAATSAVVGSTAPVSTTGPPDEEALYGDAEQTVLRPDDFDEPWSVLMPGGGRPPSIAEGPCALRILQGRAAPVAVAVRGPEMVFDIDGGSVTSAAHAFADPSTAGQFIEVLSSADYIECIRRADESLEQGGFPERTVVASTRPLDSAEEPPPVLQYNRDIVEAGKVIGYWDTRIYLAANVLLVVRAREVSDQLIADAPTQLAADFSAAVSKGLRRGTGLGMSHAELTTTTSTGRVVSTVTAPSTDELAALASLAAGGPDDVGSGWTAVLEAQGMADPRHDACVALVPGPLAELGTVAAHTGPLMRSDATGTTSVIIAYAFENASQATRWLEIVRDSAHQECERARAEATQQLVTPGVQVKLSERSELDRSDASLFIARDILTPSGERIGFRDLWIQVSRSVVITQISSHVGPLDSASSSEVAEDMLNAAELAAERVRQAT